MTLRLWPMMLPFALAAAFAVAGWLMARRRRALLRDAGRRRGKGDAPAWDSGGGASWAGSDASTAAAGDGGSFAPGGGSFGGGGASASWGGGASGDSGGSGGDGGGGGGGD